MMPEINVSLRQSDHEDLKRGLRNAPRRLRKMYAVNRDASLVIARGLREAAPEKTGALRDSINVVADDTTIAVEMNPYGFILNGGRTRAAGWIDRVMRRVNRDWREVHRKGTERELQKDVSVRVRSNRA